MDQDFQRPFEGKTLWFLAILLSMANFVAVLDMTITNVSVTSIAGGLGTSTNQGTWVITSYAVAEAITVPLTGWLAARFGAVRMFVCAMSLFGAFSFLCGFADSLGLLIAGRVLQGLAGGPMMPLTQTLLLRIFPREKVMTATTLWAMTTVVAPVAGPVLGGWLCDNYSWPWIFYINVPLAICCSYLVWRMLRRLPQTLDKARIDVVGLILLIVWVGALQLMLDEGKDLDWFSSRYIVALAIIAAIGFFAFLIWELTEEHPIVNLRVFRHRGYTACVITIAVAFGCYFAANVLIPLWLQSYMGYTPTWSGKTTAWSGVASFMVAPLVTRMVRRVDPRKLVMGGVMWLGIISIARSFFTTDISYGWIILPTFLIGLGMPPFFIPLTGLALASVEEKETASAAGLMSFLRTLSGAFATSIVTTAWEDKINYMHAELSALIDASGEHLRQVANSGMPPEMARALIDRLVTTQSVMLATNELMLMIGVLLILASFVVFVVPAPKRKGSGAG
ncbi:MAG: DHA2 family efflux MFS transporter permease subunit [Burkholderiaceae bacterium]|jgi:DHA2 family multidrug resistance protein|nr:DHA2 family efflux MFS transporter permease subunit [Burkholderiaceae bacterium]